MKAFIAAMATLTLAVPTAPAAAGPDIAPPVVRTRPAARMPEAAPPAAPPPSAACGTAGAPACPQKSAAGANPQDYRAALAAVPPERGSDPALDNGLVTAMSQLLAAGRCGEAAALATRNVRAALAARARQLCQGH
ncbi:MAG TPA: hypothetical protein VGD66_08585 [Allosphingosinicella sp.]|jgi:hypothetical protein